MPSFTDSPPRRRWLTKAVLATVGVTACLGLSAVLVGDEDGDTPQAGKSGGIRIAADYSQEWTSTTEDVAILRGNVVVEQAGTIARARKAVLWRLLDTSGSRSREYLSVYLEGDVQLDRTGESQRSDSMFLELVTQDGIVHGLRQRLRDRPGDEDPLYARAAEQRRTTERGRIQPTQMRLPRTNDPAMGGGPLLQAPGGPAIAQPTAPRGMRTLGVYPRSSIPFDVLSFKSEDTTPAEQTWVLTGGVNVVIGGLDQVGTVDLASDRVVIWTESVEEFRAETRQAADAPLQVYLEGNIVVREGENVIRATRAFYDARDQRGLMLDADLRSPLPQLGGTIRVRAERLRQLSQSAFRARRAWVTTSPFGKPGYRVQSSDLIFERRYVRPWFNARDPNTGQPIVEAVPWVTSRDNTFFIEDTPLFYAPVVSAPAEDPKIPLKRLSVGFDRIFGAQLRTGWDLFQITGLEQPEGVRWDLLVDGYSERGIGIGTEGDYRGNGLFGVPGPFDGSGLLYYLNDGGTDNLGGFRTDVPFEDNNRYRAQLRHRQRLPGNVLFLGEFGSLSDRNFLEQYYEGEFDTGKDVETQLYLRGLGDNWGWTGQARVQVNDFSTTTDWLPRLDVYGLSEPLLGGWLSWSNHSYAGYGRVRQGDAPPGFDPVAPFFVPLTAPIVGSPGSANGIIAEADGTVLMTRHRLDAPLHLGPLNITPYAQGDYTHWGGGFGGGDIDRVVGTAGVGGSVLVWRAFPRVQSRIFNLNGLAHKMRFEFDYSFTDSDTALSNVPQYNEFEENSEERVRRIFATTTFGGIIPRELDPRFYVVRTGDGSTVTAPYHELVDSQQVLRFVWRNRLQTKVGPPSRLRIRDWMRFDAGFSYFPDADRDNFGEDFGLIHGRYDWLISDRTTFTASAQYDLFDNGPEIWNFGVNSQRSRRGSVYVGLRTLQAGDLDSQIITASYTYRMSPKWVSTFGTAYDLAEDQNLGQSVTFTRIGRDFLTHVGFNYVDTKDSAGVMFMIQPRFGNYVPGTPVLGSLGVGTGGALQ